MGGTRNTIVDFFQALPSLVRFGPQINLPWLKSLFEIRGSRDPIWASFLYFYFFNVFIHETIESSII
jgi:hypothetical protein